MARAAAFSLEFDSKDFERQCLQLAKGYGKLPKYLQNKHIKSAMKRFMTQKGGNLVKSFANGLPIVITPRAYTAGVRRNRDSFSVR